MDEGQPSSARAKIVDASSRASNDEQVWLEVLNFKLEGVGFHTNLSQVSELEGLDGYCEMHKYHAMEEYHEFLWLADEYVKKFKRVPNVSMEQNNNHMNVSGEDFAHKMVSLLEAYENWELLTLGKLRECKMKLHGCKKDVSKLICGVQQELSFIDKLNEYIDEHSDNDTHMHRIDTWLRDTFSKKLGKL